MDISRNRQLTPEQRMLEMYLEQYDQINSHIDVLINMASEVQQNINILRRNNPLHFDINRNNYTHRNTFSNRNVRPSTNNRHSNSSSYIHSYYNRNSGRQTNNHNNHVQYNYNTPIEYEIYRFPLTDNITNTNTNSTNSNNVNALFSSLINQFLNSSVTVRPTVEQINNATRRILYGNIQSPLNNQCPISLEYFNALDPVREIRHCRHVFHEDELDRWFETNVRCPVCRYDIRDYGNNDAQDDSSSSDDEVPSQSQETGQSYSQIPRNSQPNNPLRTPEQRSQVVNSLLSSMALSLGIVVDPSNNPVLDDYDPNL